MSATNSLNNRQKIDYSLLPNLVKLGFSKQEAQIYLVLVREGVLPAKEIALRMKILPHAVYRIIRKLESKKLITIISSSPLSFYVLPPKLALSSYVKERSIMMEKEIKEISLGLQSNKTYSNPTSIDVITGKQKMFSVSEEMIRNSKKEVLIISIGEPSTTDLILANKRAIERGVVVRFIAHKHDKENQEYLKNLEKNGFDIRHFPDWGFHMVIIDGERSLLAVNNPEKSDDRVTIKIFSQGLSKAFRDYFYSVWEKAVKI